MSIGDAAEFASGGRTLRGAYAATFGAPRVNLLALAERL
jgi:hypothetical protein